MYLAPFLDEMLPTQVENCELNCEVSVEITGKVAASVISQKETSQRDNDETRTDEKVDGQKEKHKLCLPQQSPVSKTRHQDFEITNNDSRAHSTKHGRDYFSSQWIGYADSHCDSVFPSRHFTLDQSTHTRSSISVIQRYAPKLDELNHKRMNNSKSWVYRDASGFDPRPYDPSQHLNSTAGWLDE